jgi:hypothetical protein
MKAQVALLLAQIDKTALRNASAETTERAIWPTNNLVVN